MDYLRVPFLETPKYTSSIECLIFGTIPPGVHKKITNFKTCLETRRRTLHQTNNAENMPVPWAYAKQHAKKIAGSFKLSENICVKGQGDCLSSVWGKV